MAPSAEQVLALGNFMAERHQIYQKRAAGLPGPWTEDPILRDNRFCNVFRELDRVTIWVRENIREPFAEHPHLWFMLAIARYLNWPDTLAELLGTEAWPDHPKFSPEKLTAALVARAARGEKVYTGAYMIRAESDLAKPWYRWSKHRYLAEIVLGRLWEDREAWAADLAPTGRPKRLERVWEKFQQTRYVGWGPFMAYEVVTDLRHTRYMRNAVDILSWANAGPGAIRGLNRLFNRPLNEQPPKIQTCAEMQELMCELNALDEPRMNLVFGPILVGFPRFEMRDVEHCLCEYDKHQRVATGGGKMRSKYDWRKAQQL